MKIKLLDCTKFSQANFSSACNELDSHEKNGLIRRDFIKCAGTASLALIAPLVWSNKQAQAKSGLIPLALSALDLIREMWSVKEPTKGQITLVNNFNFPREGTVLLQVADYQDIENYVYFDYVVPPMKLNTYQFWDGPYGIYPGRKMMQGKTGRGQQQTPMIIEA
jgi:hypothetical protein